MGNVSKNKRDYEMLLIRDVAVGYPEAIQCVYTEVEGILRIIFTLRDFHGVLTLEFIHSPCYKLLSKETPPLFVGQVYIKLG